MKPPAFQFYPKQWLGDDNVLAMSWDARAMHMHLICIAWQQEPPCTIPADDTIIRRWLGNPRQWDRLKIEIFRAWKLEEGRWLQAGLLECFERQKSYRETRKANADKRWDKDAHASPNSCITDALLFTSSSTSTTENKKTKTKAAPEAFVLPEWIPQESWDDWLILRRKKRAPSTFRALNLAVDELARLRTEGLSPGSVLNNCVLQGWQGIYPPRETTNGNGGSNGHYESKSEREYRKAQQIMGIAEDERA